MPISTFFTERLYGEPLSTAHAEFIKELLNTEGWLKFIGDRNIHSIVDAESYVNRIKNTKEFYYWVVKIKETEEPIGIITFLQRDYLPHPDIGFAFLPNYHGKGYAYEASHMLLQKLMTNNRYSKVLATTLPANTSSIRLLEKLGMVFENEIFENEKLLLLYTTRLLV
jgi:[ribosomal protein S5]-alanine N-acetyltransferase